MKTNKTTGILEDKKVYVKVKLALLWVALVFLYIYNEILSLYRPGHVVGLFEGQLEGVEFTQSLLIGAAIIMALPSFMVLLSLTLKARVDRMEMVHHATSEAIAVD
jgi:hypothetical protein